jgi:hypothetical protein
VILAIFHTPPYRARPEIPMASCQYYSRSSKHVHRTPLEMEVNLGERFYHELFVNHIHQNNLKYVCCPTIKVDLKQAFKYDNKNPIMHRL